MNKKDERGMKELLEQNKKQILQYEDPLEETEDIEDPLLNQITLLPEVDEVVPEKIAGYVVNEAEHVSTAQAHRNLNNVRHKPAFTTPPRSESIVKARKNRGFKNV
jgi:hypothetical protein